MWSSIRWCGSDGWENKRCCFAYSFSKYPKALCAAHRLNLCDEMLLNSRGEQYDAECRQDIPLFQQLTASTRGMDRFLPEENRKKLKELCRTRWVERHEAFEVFSDLFLPTFCCLEAIVYRLKQGDALRCTVIAFVHVTIFIHSFFSSRFLLTQKGLVSSCRDGIWTLFEPTVTLSA